MRVNGKHTACKIINEKMKGAGEGKKQRERESEGVMVLGLVIEAPGREGEEWETGGCIVMKGDAVLTGSD